MDRHINLLQVNQFETAAFRTKITGLFKMRRTIQGNMSQSGTHNHVVWDFVESGLSKNGPSGVTKTALYYMRFREIPDIDSHFQPFMEASLIGDTSIPMTLATPPQVRRGHHSMLVVDTTAIDRDEDGGALTSSSSASSARGKRTKNAQEEDDAMKSYIAMMNNSHNAMLQHLAEALEDRKLKRILAEKKLELTRKKHRFEAQLELAKALGDKEELKKMMQEEQMRKENDETTRDAF